MYKYICDPYAIPRALPPCNCNRPTLTYSPHYDCDPDGGSPAPANLFDVETPWVPGCTRYYLITYYLYLHDPLC